MNTETKTHFPQFPLPLNAQYKLKWKMAPELRERCSTAFIRVAASSSLKGALNQVPSDISAAGDTLTYEFKTYEVKWIHSRLDCMTAPVVAISFRNLKGNEEKGIRGLALIKVAPQQVQDQFLGKLRARSNGNKG